MMDTVESYLQSMTSMRRNFGKERSSSIPKGWQYSCPEELVLKHGHRFSGKRERVKQMTPRRCFNNAYELMMKGRSLYYCEGYALGFIIPVHHAWCCDDNGVIYDPTWEQDDLIEANDYVGCIFESSFVLEEAIRNNVPGIFSGELFINERVMQGKFELQKLKEHVNV